jgi:hypothetical protein
MFELFAQCAFIKKKTSGAKVYINLHHARNILIQ